MHRDERPSSFNLSPSKSTRCTFRTVQTTRCHTEVDEHGVPHRKCQRVMQKFKECPGLPMEIVERVENDIDPDEVMKGTPFSAESGFGDTGSDVEAVFSRMDKMLGIFDEKQPQVHSSFKKKSFRQKIGDYFSWEKDCDSKMKTADDGTRHKQQQQQQRSDWKQFESDFQEI